MPILALGTGSVASSATADPAALTTSALSTSALTTSALSTAALTTAASSSIPPTGDSGWVRLAHLSPDTDRVDIRVTPRAGGAAVLELDDVG